MQLRASTVVTMITVAFIALNVLISNAAAASTDWTVTCVDGSGCRMETRAVRGGRTLGVLTMRSDGEGGLIGEMILPLNLYIPSGVHAQIDRTSFEIAPQLLACTPRGCLAAFRAAGALLGALENGLTLDTRIVDARSGQPLSLKFSLRGFISASGKL